MSGNSSLKTNNEDKNRVKSEKIRFHHPIRNLSSEEWKNYWKPYPVHSKKIMLNQTDKKYLN